MTGEVRSGSGSPLEQPSDPERKLGEMMLYVSTRLLGQPAAGATKLNKILFFAEFAHMRATGSPITGVEYQKLKNGPAPRRLLPVRDYLQQSGAAVVEDEEYLGHVQHRLRPLRAPDMTMFSETEVQALEQVLERFGGHSGTSLSDISHREPGWNMVDDGETIPYSAAFLRSGRPGSKALERARDLAALHGKR